MFRLVPSKGNASDVKKYYTQSLEREGYYFRDTEAVGTWHGRGAALLGLSGKVTQKEFFALADNRHPVLGTRLTSRDRSDATIGYDGVFSSPKSVAIMALLFGDTRLIDVFRSCAFETMAQMENDMEARVRKDDADYNRRTGNMVWADFMHFTTRPEEALYAEWRRKLLSTSSLVPPGAIPDLDLHMHCYCFNKTWDKEETIWKAGQFKNLKRDAPYYEAAFHARFSRAVEALGYPIDRHGAYWDIAGVDRELIETFSNRSAKVDKDAKRLGITDPKQKDKLGARNRKSKRSDLTMDVLRDVIWPARLTTAEKDKLVDLVRQAKARTLTRKRPRVTPRQAMLYAVETGFDRYSVVSDKQLMERALRYGFGDVIPEEIQAEFDKADVLKAEEDGRLLVTTEKVHAEEQSMLGLAKRGKGTCIPFGVKTPPAHFTKGQVATFKHVLSSADRVILVHGGAGTGKTTTLSAVTKETLSAVNDAIGGGYFFGATNPATETLRKEGFDARTVQYLLLSEPLQHQIRGQTIFVDEAGLLGTKDMRALLEITERLRTRVVLVGDVKQHAPVPRGDSLRLLQSHAGLKTAHQTEIVRQTGAYKEAVELLQKHDTLEGLQKFKNMGWVVEAPDDVRDELLAEDYVWQLRARKRVMVVAPTHREGRRITKSIRAWMKKDGMLEGAERSHDVLVNKHYDSWQKRDYAYYRPGMVVQFMRRAAGIEQGALLEVKRIQDGKVFVGEQEKELPMQNADWLQVHERDTISLAAGDKIVPTQTGQTMDGHRLQTKAVYEVEGFDEAGNIKLTNGWKVSKDFKHLAYGYYATSIGAQSATVDRVLLSFGADAYGALSMEQQLVSLSRAKESARIYTEDFDEMKLHAIKSSQRGTATELMEGKLSGSAQPKLVAAQVARNRELLHRQRAYRERLEQEEYYQEGVRYGTGYGR